MMSTNTIKPVGKVEKTRRLRNGIYTLSPSARTQSKSWLISCQRTLKKNILHFLSVTMVNRVFLDPLAPIFGVNHLLQQFWWRVRDTMRLPCIQHRFKFFRGCGPGRPLYFHPSIDENRCSPGAQNETTTTNWFNNIYFLLFPLFFWWLHFWLFF